MSFLSSRRQHGRQHALEIPEVLEVIFSYSCRAHLLSFSLVCASNPLSAEKQRLAAWDILRAKVVEQSRVVRHTTVAIVSQLHGMGHKNLIPSPGSIFLDSIPLEELILRGNVSLDDSVLPILPELSTLRSLKLLRISLTTVGLQQILESLPGLLELEMEPVSLTHKTSLGDPKGYMVPLAPLQTFELRKFRLKHFMFQESVIVAYLSAMPKLVELFLVEQKRVHPQTNYQYGIAEHVAPYDRKNFVKAVARSCPDLQSFHLSFDFSQFPYRNNTNEGNNQMDVQTLARHLPRSIHTWSFGVGDMGNPLIHELGQRYFDRLTTLEVTASRHEYYVSGDAFHSMLCTSESIGTLRHLKILGIPLYAKLLKLTPQITLEPTATTSTAGATGTSANVDAIEGSRGIYPNPEYESMKPYWQCRNLLTLHINIGGERSQQHSELDTRRPISYIVKVCPNIQDLRIQKENIVFQEMGGVCQLTELEDLERLAFDITHVNQVAEADLGWARQTFDLSGIDALGGDLKTRNWKWLWGGGAPSSDESATDAAVEKSTESRSGRDVGFAHCQARTRRRRNGDHDPLTLEEAYAVGEKHEVKRVLQKLRQGLKLNEPCWPQLESLKIQIYWTHASNIKVEHFQKRLPHVLCRVGTNALITR
ncbi:hypothetical protein BG004_005806 [Podila humilis]|nr:hypothetical protein BG004_005806 [Podila humilis]